MTLYYSRGSNRSLGICEGTRGKHIHYKPHGFVIVDINTRDILSKHKPTLCQAWDIY